VNTGSSIDSGTVRNHPTFIRDALPSFAWLMAEYVKRDPSNRAGQTIVEQTAREVDDPSSDSTEPRRPASDAVSM